MQPPSRASAHGDIGSTSSAGQPASLSCSDGNWFVLEDGPDYETDDDPETLALFLQQFEAGDDGTTAPQPSPKKRICVRHAAVSAVQQAVSSAAQPARDSTSNVAVSISDPARDSASDAARSSAQPATKDTVLTPRDATRLASDSGSSAPQLATQGITLTPRGAAGSAAALELQPEATPKAMSTQKPKPPLTWM